MGGDTTPLGGEFILNAWRQNSPRKEKKLSEARQQTHGKTSKMGVKHMGVKHEEKPEEWRGRRSGVEL